MRTDELIAMLSTNVEPVDRRKLARTFGTALAVGGAAAVVVVLLGFGLRTDLTYAGAFVSLVLKIIFTIGVFGLASTYLIRFARPGGERGAPLMLLALPFVAIMALAAISLASVPHSHWNSMILWGPVAGMPSLDPGDCDRAVRRDHLGGAPSDADRSAARGSPRRARRRRIERDRLRAPLRGRFDAFLRSVVWRDDHFVHPCRRRARPKASALVMCKSELITEAPQGGASEFTFALSAKFRSTNAKVTYSFRSRLSARPRRRRASVRSQHEYDRLVTDDGKAAPAASQSRDPMGQRASRED